MSIRVQHIRGTTTEVESVTPLAGELGFDTTRKEAHLGDGATAGGIRLGKKNIVEIVSPAQITADQNDYSPTSLKHAGALYINSDAARSITGLVPLTVTDSTDGRTIQIYNTGAFNITLKDQSGSSTAANRFDLNGADVVLAAKTAVILRYSNAASRWTRVGSTVGSSVADGAVIARTLAGSAMGMSMINGTLVESHAGSAVTFAIKTLAGGDPSSSDPVHVLVRNATPGTGDYTLMTLTAATSLVVSSGSSLGTSNSVAFRTWIVGFNDAGTFRLGVINCLSGTSIYPLGHFPIASSTAEGGAGAADSAQTFYTGTAVASKAYAVLGYMTWESGLAAAGTWSASPTRIQLYGPGVPLPGAEIQSVRTDTGAVATGTTLVPLDDTIPQNTEGDQYMSQAITPNSAANLLAVTASAQLASSAASSNGIVSIFRDAVASALVTAIQSLTAASIVCRVDLSTRQLAGATASTTFKVRAGGNNAGTMTFNGSASARLFGGVFNSYLDVRELMA